MDAGKNETVADESTGNPSLDGWWYQCDVSVWAALDLLLVKRLASAVQLEPASQEDLEAELETPVVASTVATASSLLVVQAKLRRTGQWTPRALKSMVEHGKKRESALKRLQEPNVRYVLATTADVQSALRPLLVNDFMERPEADSLPVEVFGEDAAKQAAGRFAILGQHTEQRVVERIERLLMSPLSVPQPRLAHCRAQLRADAMDRMRSGAAWQRSEVEKVIRAHGGAIPSDVTETYVKPDCWGDIVRRMETSHAMILVGPSGTGKTTTARAVIAHLRELVAGLDVVEVESPAQIRSCHNEGPTLFYLDDPWGKYEVTTERRSWTADLSAFLHQASAHRMFVVTTRSDILGEAVDETKAFARWTVRLDSGNYGVAQRRELYRSRLEQLPTGSLKTAALDARSTVLKELDTPFEIDRFFKHLKPGPVANDRDEAAFVRRVLRETQRDAIETEVKLLVQARQATRWAAVLWGLIAANRSVDRAELPDIRRRMAARDATLKAGLNSLVDALVAGGTLRQPASRISYAHPRVEKGLLAAMRADAEPAEDALATLLDVLVGLDRGDAGQGSRTAVRVYAAIVARTKWRMIPPEAQAGVDRWLERALGTDADDYLKLLQRAAATGSDQSVPAELARWLAPDTASGRSLMLDAWKEPQRPAAWYERAREHPLTRHICIQFITKVLPVQSAIYPAAMADTLDRLADDLGPAWLYAAQWIVEQEYLSNGRAIAYGAMRYEENRLPLLDAALQELRSLQISNSHETDVHAIEDGHYDEDDFEDYGSYGECAQQVCAAYVRRLRGEGNWHALAESTRLAELLGYWASDICPPWGGTASPEEVVALFDRAAALGDECNTWRVAQAAWLPEFERRLRARLSEPPSERQAGSASRPAVECALVAAPHLLREEVVSRLERNAHGALCELLHEVGRMRVHGLCGPHKNEYQVFVANLPEPCGELVALLCPTPRTDRLSAAALDVAVQALDQCTGHVRAALLEAVAAQRGISPELAGDVLASDDPEIARAGLRAAHAAGFWDLVEEAIGHLRADVRCLAFELLRERNGGAVLPAWLALARDKSSRVRKALVEALEAQAPGGALPALVLLCQDRWVSQSHGYPEETYPIARRAARALANVSHIDDDAAAALLETAERTSDPKLQWRLHVELAAKASDATRQALGRIAFGEGPRQARISALHGLASAAQPGTDGILAPVTPAWLSTAHPTLALWGAVGIGTCAPLPRVDEVCRQLAGMGARRALLIAVATGLHVRDETLAAHALDRLPSAHPARGMFDHPGKLPADTLDDLGEIEIVNAVLGLCEDLVEERPKAIRAG